VTLADTPLVDRSTRTIRRWVTTAGERLYADTGDDGWTSSRPPDLRRTWGTLLVTRCEVEPGLVMEWGGWEDYYDERTPRERMEQRRSKLEVLD